MTTETKFDESLVVRDQGRFAPKGSSGQGAQDPKKGRTTDDLVGKFKVKNPKAAAAAKRAANEAKRKRAEAERLAKKAAAEKTAAARKAAAAAERAAKAAERRADAAQKADTSEDTRRAGSGAKDTDDVRKTRATFDDAQKALREADAAVDAAGSDPAAIAAAGQARRAAQARVDTAKAAMLAAEKAAKSGSSTTSAAAVAKPKAAGTETVQTPKPGQNTTYGPGTGEGWDWKPPEAAKTEQGGLHEDALPATSPGGGDVVSFDGQRSIYGDGSAFGPNGWDQGVVSPEEVAQARRERTARRAAAGLPPLPADQAAGLQGKSVRVVRTAEGARRFGESIGSPIVLKNRARASRVRTARTRKAPAATDGTSTDFPDVLDVRLVNHKPDRNLADASKVQRIENILPDAEYVPYSQVPFINDLHRQMGVDDPRTHDVADYMARRDRVMTSQPLVDVPFDQIVVTQPVVNRDRVQQIRDDPATGGTKPQHFVRYGGQTYVLNGHHRVVAQIAAGEASAQGHLLDLDTR